MTKRSQKPQYGIDAPGLVRFFFIAGTGSLAIVSCIQLLSITNLIITIIVTVLFLIIAFYLLGMGTFMIYYSKVTKLNEREKQLDLVQWSGDELVLDVGCGRGLMLVGAAKRLNNSGRAIGIDIWQQQDQSNNNSSAVVTNAELEDVRSRIEVQTADMRQMPFPENYFDIVVSNWTVHNLEAESDRQKTLDEIIRVLKPGGRLILTDIVNQAEYAKYLAQRGMTNIELHNNKRRDRILKVITFSSFAPSTVLACKVS